MNECAHPEATWHKVIGRDELPEGRVMTVTSVGATWPCPNFEGAYGALDNRCPHQGGPLGEGSIEKGWLRCPWHCYDYNPLDGVPPEGFTDRPDCFATEIRDSELGKISKEQRAAEYAVWQTGLQNLDFAELARSCGGLVVRVGEVRDLEEGIRTALDHEGPSLVAIDADPLLV